MAQTPGMIWKEILADVASYGICDVAEEAADILDALPNDPTRGGSTAEVVLEETQWPSPGGEPGVALAWIKQVAYLMRLLLALVVVLTR